MFLEILESLHIWSPLFCFYYWLHLCLHVRSRTIVQNKAHWCHRHINGPWIGRFFVSINRTGKLNIYTYVIHTFFFTLDLYTSCRYNVHVWVRIRTSVGDLSEQYWRGKVGVQQQWMMGWVRAGIVEEGYGNTSGWGVREIPLEHRLGTKHWLVDTIQTPVGHSSSLKQLNKINNNKKRQKTMGNYIILSKYYNTYELMIVLLKPFDLCKFWDV